MCGCLLHTPAGYLARNPGMCPDWESNQQRFGLQAPLNPLSHTSQGSFFKHGFESLNLLTFCISLSFPNNSSVEGPRQFDLMIFPQSGSCPSRPLGAGQLVPLSCGSRGLVKLSFHPFGRTSRGVGFFLREVHICYLVIFSSRGATKCHSPGPL